MAPPGDAWSVADVVAELVASVDGLERTGERRVEYRRSGRPFLVVEGDRVRFRLRQDVARAALTTPGTERDPAGPEWIALESRRSDRFSRDRARAWFDFALRELTSEAGRADPPAGKRPDRPAGALVSAGSGRRAPARRVCRSS
jgi:hypothetical protein